MRFQSTLPARGATQHPINPLCAKSISIHAPRTGSDVWVGHFFGWDAISIHAPRTGSDQLGDSIFRLREISIHAPRTGSDVTSIQPAKKMEGISIHAPRTGSDETLLQRGWFTEDFNPRSPHGERRKHHWGHLNPRRFQSTLPARGATAYHRLTDEREAISIHAPRTGSDTLGRRERPKTATFQSTLPARGATDARTLGRRERPYFNPRSPHGERLRVRACPRRPRHFNPRSPHGERPDAPAPARCPHHFNPRSPHGERPRGNRRENLTGGISIHAPRTGSDGCLYCKVPAKWLFQSTLPARGATQLQAHQKQQLFYFNPRSPHGERRSCQWRLRFCAISIHAPRTGSDPLIYWTKENVMKFQSTLPARGATGALLRRVASGLFQSTLPARGATAADDQRVAAVGISIHAPRTGSDRCRRRTTPLPQYFNPRSPHGERHARRDALPIADSISIHAPRTGSDSSSRCRERRRRISIHAPRTGSDRHADLLARTGDAFQSTLPARGATAPPMTSVSPPSVFQSTLPARGATNKVLKKSQKNTFQSTLPARGATVASPRPTAFFSFQSTLPARGATNSPFVCFRFSTFQSTLPARGATARRCATQRPRTDFNPRSPHGERRAQFERADGHLTISIHAPRTGSDKAPKSSRSPAENFNPRSPHGERRARKEGSHDLQEISIHAPRTGSDTFLALHALR